MNDFEMSEGWFIQWRRWMDHYQHCRKLGLLPHAIAQTAAAEAHAKYEIWRILDENAAMRRNHGR